MCKILALCDNQKPRYSKKFLHPPPPQKRYTKNLRSPALMVKMGSWNPPFTQNMLVAANMFRVIIWKMSDVKLFMSIFLLSYIFICLQIFLNVNANFDLYCIFWYSELVQLLMFEYTETKVGAYFIHSNVSGHSYSILYNLNKLCKRKICTIY